MIDKVGRQTYYDHEKANQIKRKNVDSSEFYLNLDKQGVIYEPNEEKRRALK